MLRKTIFAMYDIQVWMAVDTVDSWLSVHFKLEKLENSNYQLLFTYL